MSVFEFKFGKKHCVSGSVLAGISVAKKRNVLKEIRYFVV